MKRPLILHIDDSDLVLQIVGRGLQQAGFEVVSVDGFSAVSDALRKHGLPDLILLDIRMPSVQGDDLAEFFLRQWRLSMPVLLFSDLPKEEINKRVASSGATGGVRKHEGLPVLIQMILQTLQVDTRHLGPHVKDKVKARVGGLPAVPAASAAPAATAPPPAPAATPAATTAPAPVAAAAAASRAEPPADEWSASTATRLERAAWTPPTRQPKDEDAPASTPAPSPNDRSERARRSRERVRAAVTSPRPTTAAAAPRNGNDWAREISLWAARVRQLLSAGSRTKESWQRRLPQVRRELHWLRDEAKKSDNALARRLSRAAAKAFDATDGDPGGLDILALFVTIMIEVAAGQTERGEALLKLLTGS
ncbi:MAG: response regulator [Planctomycetota bacterium]